MELMSTYRDPLIDFSEVMRQWYNCYQTGRTKTNEKDWGCAGAARRYARLPVDRRSPHWFLHTLDCTLPPPTARKRLSQAGVDMSELAYCQGRSVLMVTDLSGLPLGFDTLPAGWSSSLGGGEVAGGDGEGAVATTQTILGLLCHSMEAPMGGGSPRRPQILRVSDKKLHRLLSQGGSALSVLKVALWPYALGGWSPLEVDPETGVIGPSIFNMHWPSAHCCHVCKKHSILSQLKPCPHCKAVLYCSEQCSQSDYTQRPVETSHQYWCEDLALYMSRQGLLADLPFSYALESTAVDFDMQHFLNKNKLDSGYWTRWSSFLCSQRSEFPRGLELSRKPVSPWLSGHSEPYGPLKEEADVLLCGTPHSPPSLSSPFVSWSQYYSWRGLRPSSPVASLLSAPLSLYYIITSLIPQDFPELNILKKRSLKVHIIESCREFHCVMVFWELSNLLPHMTFELSFIGERLPLQCDEQQLLLQKTNGRLTLVKPALAAEGRVDKRSIRVKGYRRAYHMLQGFKPDLVIGFRPAISLHDSWLSTLPRLQSLRVPAYFCEISELSCVCSQPVMTDATGGGLSPAHINPFRCPLRLTGGNNLLPRYSSAFIFHLIYKPVAVCPQRPPLANPQAEGQADPQHAVNHNAPVQRERRQAAPRRRR